MPILSFSQRLKNAFRLGISPITQLFMMAGIFPAQGLSAMKKTPGLGGLINKLSAALGFDPRPANSIFQDFHQNNEQLILDNTPLAYKTNFNNDALLETFRFEHMNFHELPASQQYYRIHCSGNSGNCSRFFSELAALSNTHPELKTLTYNHPGVEGSRGVTLSQDDLVNALYQQVMVIINQGVEPSHIELTGFSIGAATAALTAKKLKDAGYDVNLYCDRTLASMPQIVTNNLPILGPVFKFLKLIPIVKELITYIILPTIEWLVIRPLLWLMNWNMEPAKAYQQLDASHKELTYVKPQSMGEGFWRAVGKYLGQFTGFYKRGNADKTIGVDVSLASRINKSDNNLVQYKERFQRLKLALSIESVLTEEAFVQIKEDISYIKAQTDNAITLNALNRLDRLCDSLQSLNDKHQGALALVNLAIVSWKSRRFQGTVAKDAHNVLSHDIMSREIKGLHWMMNPLDNAAEETLPEVRNSSSISGLTRYSMFHAAVKDNSEYANAVLEQTQEPTF